MGMKKKVHISLKRRVLIIMVVRRRRRRSLELTVIAFLLEELDMVMLAVELSLMWNVVGRGYSTSSICAFEAALMLCCSVHPHLHFHYQLPFISLPGPHYTYYLLLTLLQEQLQCKLPKMGCQMPFCNPEQCFGTPEYFFCSNGRCQIGVPFK